MENKPERRISIGAIQIAVWKNQRPDHSAYHTITIQKNYKSPEGEWKQTQSIPANDLPKLQLALSRAFEYVMLEQEAKRARR